MYYLGDTINFEKKEINVKQHFRKGKIVKASRRKINKIKTVITTASVLGLPTATYFIFKKRYINNLNNFAKKLKINDSLGKKFGDEIESINFTLGGLGDIGKSTTLDQSNALSLFIKKGLNPKIRKKQAFVSLTHYMTTKEMKIKNNLFRNSIWFPSMIESLSRPFFKGYNKDSFKLAEEIYNYSVKNPGKKINLIGYSAGSNIYKDINYILSKKGINTNLITIGGVNLGLLNPKNALHIMGDKDEFNFLKHKNNKILNNVNSHHLKNYLFDDKNNIRQDTHNLITSFLFS